jgi:small-conductance mechanosensitive channel
MPAKPTIAVSRSRAAGLSRWPAAPARRCSWLAVPSKELIVTPRPFRLAGIIAGFVLVAFGIGAIVIGASGIQEVSKDALSTALNTSFFASSVGTFAIVMGIALVLSGIGFIVLAAGLLGPEGLRRRRTKTPPPVTTTPAAV